MAIYQAGINQQNCPVWPPIRRPNGQHELIGGGDADRAACSRLITTSISRRLFPTVRAALALVREPGPSAYFEREVPTETGENA
jgi:hypothetical protein